MGITDSFYNNPGTQLIANTDPAAKILGRPSIFAPPASPPPPPDTQAINAQQAQDNLAAARQTSLLNNPNLINQYGTTNYTMGPDGRPIQTQTLSPDQQKIYDQTTQSKIDMGNLANQGINSLNGKIGQSFDISGAPAAPGSSDQTRQNVIDAMMSRSNKSLGYANDQQNSDLIAAGIRPGTEAYRRAQEQQGQNRNDAQSQAEIAGGNAAQQAFNQDTANRQNYISNALTQRQTPFNEVQALMSGSQVNNPFAGQGYQAGATVQPVNSTASANMLNQYNADIYNMQTGASNNTTSAAASIGAAALMSDRRLKTEIERIGTHKLGIGLYRWRYIDNPPESVKDMANWGTYACGVMADELKEVMPEAVIRIGDYDAVNYAMIGE